MRAIGKPHGIFKGRNIMTPNSEGYFKLKEGYAELSSGRGIYNDPIFGVTVRPDPAHERSKLFHSLSAAMDYIEEMS